MELYQAIQSLYPAAEPQRDFALRDDGYGAYIEEWHLAAPRPTRAELAAFGVTEGSKDMSVLKEWADLNSKLIDQAQDIIDATARPRRLSMANGISAQIAAAPDGEPFADSGLSKARAGAIDALWAGFDTWLQTPLPEAGGLAPIQILSQRES